MVINAEKSYPALTGLRFHDTIGKTDIKEIHFETTTDLEN